MQTVNVSLLRKIMERLLLVRERAAMLLEVEVSFGFLSEFYHGKPMSQQGRDGNRSTEEVTKNPSGQFFCCSKPNPPPEEPTTYTALLSLRLEKTSEIIKSSRHPNTPMPAKPCPQVPHLHGF